MDIEQIIGSYLVKYVRVSKNLRKPQSAEFFSEFASLADQTSDGVQDSVVRVNFSDAEQALKQLYVTLLKEVDAIIPFSLFKSKGQIIYVLDKHARKVPYSGSNCSGVQH
jgi:hypothetical protein